MSAERITAAGVRIGDIVSRGGPENAFQVVAVFTPPTRCHVLLTDMRRIQGATDEDMTIRARSQLTRYAEIPQP